MKIGSKVLCLPPHGGLGSNVTRETRLYMSAVHTVKAVSPKGLITLADGQKLRDDGGTLRCVPAPTGYHRSEWLAFTPELEAERDAARKLCKLRHQVTAIKADTLTLAQCEAILRVVTP